MSETERCPLCEAEHIDQSIEFAFGVCTDCGFVVDDRERSIESEYIEAPKSPDSSGSSELSTEWTQVVKVQDASEQNLVDFLSMTEKLGEALLVSTDGRVRSAEVATEAWKRNVLHGRSMDAGAGAAVHLACRERGCPRPARKVAEAAGIKVTTLHDIYRPLTDGLAINLDSPEPAEFVPFIFESLERPTTGISTAQALLRDRNDSVVGNPAGIAAGAVYVTLQCQLPEDTATYREIAQAIGMTKETVWKRATELRPGENG